MIQFDKPQFHKFSIMQQKFAKDNYKHRTPSVSHTDAMKKLIKEFAKNKI